MDGSKEVSNAVDSSGINTKTAIYIIIGIILLVVGFYLYKFHNGFSIENGDWGTFGDYVGGILNPVIAAFAFYLIAKSYELQKKELAETRKLLEVSTNAQKDQIKLAALTALLNSNLTRISMIESDKGSLLQGRLYGSEGAPIKLYSTEFFSTQDNLEKKIENLVYENNKLEQLIKKFLAG